MTKVSKSESSKISRLTLAASHVSGLLGVDALTNERTLKSLKLSRLTLAAASSASGAAGRGSIKAPVGQSTSAGSSEQETEEASVVAAWFEEWTSGSTGRAG